MSDKMNEIKKRAAENPTENKKQAERREERNPAK